MYRSIDIRKHHSAACRFAVCMCVCAKLFTSKKQPKNLPSIQVLPHFTSLSLSLSLTHTQNTESSKTPTQYHFAHEILRNSEFQISQISQNRERERERERDGTSDHTEFYR